MKNCVCVCLCTLAVWGICNLTAHDKSWNIHQWLCDRQAHSGYAFSLIVPCRSALINVITLRNIIKKIQRSKKIIVTIKAIQMNMLINIPLNCTETKRHRVCSPLPRCSAYFVIMLQSCRDCCLLVMIFKSQLMINTFGSDSCKRPVLYLHTFSCCSDSSDVHGNVEGHGGWKGTVREVERGCHAGNNSFDTFSWFVRLTLKTP